MRGILYAGMGVLVAMAVAAALGWAFRIPIATHFLTERLGRAGFPDAEFEVRALGWSRIRIEPLVLAGEDAPTVERVSARFQPLKLWRGDIRHLEISLIGLSAALERSGGAIRIAGMPEMPGDREGPVTAGDGIAGLATVPTLHLRDARITIESPVGRWSARIDADVQGGSAGPRSARIDAGIVNNRLVVEGEASARYDGNRIAGSARLRENDGFEIELDGRVDDPLRDPHGRVEYRVDMPAAADLPWPFLPGAPPSAGRIQVAGSASGRITSTAVPDDIAGALQAVIAGGWRGDYRLESRGLAMNARFESLELDAAGEWRTEDGQLSVSAGDGGELRIGRIAEPLWSQLSPPAAARPLLAGPVRVRWQAGDWLHLLPASEGDGVRFSGLPRFTLDWPEQPGEADVDARFGGLVGADRQLRAFGMPDATLNARDLRLGATAIDRVAVVGGIENLLDGPTGELDLSVDAPSLERDDLQARAFRLRLPLAIAAADGGTRVTLRGEGRIEAERVALPQGFRSTGRFVARMTDGVLRLDEQPDYRLDLMTDAIRFETGPNAPGWLGHIDVSGGAVTVSGDDADVLPLAIRLNGYGAQLPEHDLRVDGIAGRLRPRAINDWLTFAVERLHQTGADPFIAPIAVAGGITRRPDGLALSGQGRLADGALPFTFSGQALPDAAAGVINVDVPDLAFQPDGLQPQDVLPALAERVEAEGGARGSARIAWGEDGVDGSATATITDMDVTSGAATISGLRGELELDRLRPPRTPRSQRLEADFIDAGVRIDRPTLEFAVERLQGSPFGIHVIAAEGRVVEGTIAVRDWRFDPFAQVYDPTVLVEGVSLEKLLERLSIEGLEGRGQLSGPIPLFITEEGVAIRDGRLRGLDGHVRYRSARAERALGDTNRTVDLMLQALRDFDYEKIEIDLVRELAGASRVDIQMQGSNPDVLDGHPFKFNIAITGDVDPLLEAVARGRELTDELIQRHLQLRNAQSE
ncbi:intermembrane phospholipid transport protein YdbH family protein [Halofilum ochraceum]|uniref:intermembrane phospholipid transport protein YdbH family protein n=1 Tax=Halofilum ochraceum TaxID=1611323 RepID=UPI0009F3FF1C|nr:YdbH domain-containing protein [Halofilum ochraceum]